MNCLVILMDSLDVDVDSSDGFLKRLLTDRSSLVSSSMIESPSGLSEISLGID